MVIANQPIKFLQEVCWVHLQAVVAVVCLLLLQCLCQTKVEAVTEAGVTMLEKLKDEPRQN
jgi:hypothetical protein